MALGDDAKAAGYPLVPGSGEEGKIKYGAREINRTRDFIAQVLKLVPTTRDHFRAGAKINVVYGDPGPGDGVEGEVVFRVL